jgi:DNA-binding response OmpR family regulator
MEKKRVLIAEDDTVIASMYNMKLVQNGFDVKLADNGADALEIAKKEKFDLILLDVVMPQLDGFTVLQELKKIDSFKDIPIIMLTNLGTAEDKKKGQEYGAVDYLVKASLTPTQVSEAINKYLK